jgi:hypothetical protein
MKMIMAVLNGDDVKAVTNALIEGGYQVTKMASSGGFLKAKSTTLISCVRNERLERALEIIRTASCKKLYPASAVQYEGKVDGRVMMAGSNTGFPNEIVMGGATVFVLNVEQFVKM